MTDDANAAPRPSLLPNRYSAPMYVNVVMEHFVEDSDGNMVPDEDRPEGAREVHEKVFLAKVGGGVGGWQLGWLGGQMGWRVAGWAGWWVVGRQRVWNGW